MAATTTVPQWKVSGDWFDVCKCNISCPCTFTHYRETILQAEHAAEFVRATKLMDVIAQEERHEVDLKDALILG